MKSIEAKRAASSGASPQQVQRLKENGSHPPGMHNVEGAASSLQAMLPLQRAAAVQKLQQMRGNGFVARVQAKMAVGPAGGSYEQEADRIAERVMRMSNPQTAQSQGLPEDDLQLKPAAGEITRIFRQVEPEGPDDDDDDEIQLKGERGGFSVPQAVESRLEARRGGGQPLSSELRDFMETRFGADFGDVRLHSDSEAVELVKGLGARAFTRGQDIYMGRGQDPQTDSGQRLIAHELTHVVQQGAARDASIGRATLRTIFRGAIQRRKGKSRRRYQNADWSKLPNQMKTHIMDGEVRDHKPKGLHAYTNGSLSTGVNLLKKFGNK